MFEKVNPSHPDKVADRIAGALVDLAYKKRVDPKVAVEVLIGHGDCHIIIESSAPYALDEVEEIVWRIAGKGIAVDLVAVAQDPILSHNQDGAFRCGDNGIFRGVPVTAEQRDLSVIARKIYDDFGTDGKYILDGKRLIICQSHAPLVSLQGDFPDAEINPLGYWTGGPDVDTGATNRKLGSDMADSVTGGGLHGKDLSKADVSLNICAWLEAQRLGRPVELCCAIGDHVINGRPYEYYVDVAREYIESVGGFEKFAEWGLV